MLILTTILVIGLAVLHRHLAVKAMLAHDYGRAVVSIAIFTICFWFLLSGLISTVSEIIGDTISIEEVQFD